MVGNGSRGNDGLMSSIYNPTSSFKPSVSLVRGIVLPAMYELGPLWKYRESTIGDDGKMKGEAHYPRHVWVAGGKKSNVMQKWDTWMEVDFQAFAPVLGDT